MRESLQASKGVEVWLDEHAIDAGDRIDDAIRDGIDQCDELLVLVSSRSIDSAWVIFEPGAAWGQRKRVTVVYDKIPSTQVPAPLHSYRSEDLNNFPKVIQQVAKRAGAKKK